VFVCRSLKWSVFMRFSSQYFVCIYHLFVCLSLVQPSLTSIDGHIFSWALFPVLFTGSVHRGSLDSSLVLSEVIGVCLFVQFSFVSRSMWYVHSEVQHNEASLKKHVLLLYSVLKMVIQVLLNLCRSCLQKNGLCRVKLYKSKLVCLNASVYLVISHSATLRNIYSILSTSNINNRVMLKINAYQGHKRWFVEWWVGWW
jgi:hypothetical protein